MHHLTGLNNILNLNQKKQFITLVVLMLISMTLEISLLKFVFELLNSLSGNTKSTNSFITDFFLNLKIEDNKILIIIFLIFSIYLFKTLLNLTINWKKANFIFKVKENLSLKFLKGYLYMPRVFHLRTNTAQLIKNITSEIDSLMSSLLSISNVFLESIILIGIISFLFIFNFKITLVCLILFTTFSLIISYFNSRKTIFLGKERVKIVEKRLQNIIESLTGSKTYELSGLRDNALSIFSKNNIQLSKISIETFFRNTAPKPLFELFTASVITLFLFIIYDENTKLSVLAPTLVVFLAAAYRLIPSFSTILSSLQGFQYNIQSLNNLLIDSVKFKKIDNQKQSQIKFQKIINLKNVSFTYNNLNDDIDRNDILKEINLEIHQGEKIGIVGESGSGKSTLLDVLMGLLSPTEGLIKVDDTNIKSNETGWQKNIGCVPQDVFVIDDSLKKNIAFGLDEDLIEDKKIEKAINQANLEKFVQSLEEGVETKIGERGERVSGGQKQRVGIARALYFEPEVLILDEPTSALDKKTQKKIVEEIFLNNSKKTIIFVSHDKNNLIKCDKIYKLENKKLSLL
jgi:ATP-binding cassette, subfamily B, bacterial PglK